MFAPFSISLESGAGSPTHYSRLRILQSDFGSAQKLRSGAPVKKHRKKGH